jgi:hypothetical protein
MLLVLLLAAAAGNELRHWHHSAVARERAAAAQREAERRATCALVARAVSVAEGQGRQDLGEVKDGLPPCLRAVDCRYLIELDIALIAGGREDLVAQLRKALYAAPCDDGLDFARKHGLPAYASGDLSRHQQVAS